MGERTIPFFNYRALAGDSLDQLTAIFRDVAERGAFIMQAELEKFESEAANYLGVKHFWGVADGTTAIYLLLRAINVGQGDEVILPSHTYVASADAVQMVGATPILAEMRSDRTIDPQDIERLITDRTVAIMPTQLNGRIADMDPILQIAKKYSLRVLEDGAQAFGARYNGRSVGSFDVGGTISFYPAKVLGCFGDGGGIATNDEQVSQMVYMLRNHGRDQDGIVQCWGTNSRLDNLQAAILSFKLKSFPKEIQKRRELASIYHQHLSQCEFVSLPPPPTEGKYFDIYQNYEIEADRRDDLRRFLADHKVASIVQWAGKAVHQMPALALKQQLPKTDEFFKRCMLLPMNTSLTEDDIAYVSKLILDFYS